MNNGQKPPPEDATNTGDEASDGLADSSLNQAPAPPNGLGPVDEGRRKIPGNDQAEGLEKAERAGGTPART